MEQVLYSGTGILLWNRHHTRYCNVAQEKVVVMKDMYCTWLVAQVFYRGIGNILWQTYCIEVQVLYC